VLGAVARRVSQDLNERCYTFSFLFLCIHTALSSRAENGHQMYSGGSAVSKASIDLCRDLAHHPLIFTGRGSKVRSLAEPLAFENAARYLNSETNLLSNDDHPMSFSS